MKPELSLKIYISGVRIFFSLLNSKSQSSSSLSKSYSTNSPISARAATTEGIFSTTMEFSKEPSKIILTQNSIQWHWPNLLLPASKNLFEKKCKNSPFHMYPQQQTEEQVFQKPLSCWELEVPKKNKQRLLIKYPIQASFAI